MESGFGQILGGFVIEETEWLPDTVAPQLQKP